MLFEGKTVLVTGSGRGIGREIALTFAREGADIVINYVHNQDPANEVAQEITQLGRRAIIVRANVGNQEAIEKLFSVIQSEFGKLDIFISNAASGFNRPGLQQKISGWEHTINVNARAFLQGTQLAVPLMLKTGRGKIIAITSPGADRVLPDYISVGASKAALNALVRYFAVELAPIGISVNAISPGIVETDALKHFAFMENQQVIENAINQTPAGRLVLPEDVANTAVFLCSEKAEMIRGQVIVVDGGYTLPVSGY
jgi:enoyl-[acyl-carrier protein] reductase III